jgi:glutamate racemase
MNHNDRPIGVFDSGLGGLTVLRALKEKFPHESFIYLGDTARVPYGNKSNNTVSKYANEIVDFLLAKNVKAIVVACNTVSALVLTELKSKLSIPIMGVIEPGVKAAHQITNTNKIGIIGTLGTIHSSAYENQLKKMNSNLEVNSQACPLLVPLAEEGWMEENIVKDILLHYLSPLIKKDIDTLILGCTHYPVFSSVMEEILGPNIQLIDSPKEVATAFFDLLNSMNYLAKNKLPGKLSCFVTDKTKSVHGIAGRFLGSDVSKLYYTDLEY